MITAIGVDGGVRWVSIAYDFLSAIIHLHWSHNGRGDELVYDLVVREIIGVYKRSFHHEVTKALRTNKFIR